LAPSGGVGSAPSARISPDDEISALVQLSDDESRLNQQSAAITGYHSAVSLAERAANVKLEAVALAHLADAQDTAGDAKSAAQSYQQLLVIDSTSNAKGDAKGNDAAAAASDWFNYSQFLQKHGKPSQFVYVCLLQAETLLSEGPELNAVQSARRDIEAKLGTAAAGARNNKVALLKTAATLPPTAF
jgi:hypothetical protein